MSWLPVMALVLFGSCAPGTGNQELEGAILEMQRANYFTFTMLLHMMPPSDDRFRGNLTFFMPNDRLLSKARMYDHNHDVAELLLRHSIPSPMLFEELQHIPTGSLIPSSNPGYALNISNGGSRKSFFLNNAKLISPNICTAGSAFRCHGIDALLNDSTITTTTTTANPTKPNDSTITTTTANPTNPNYSNTTATTTLSPSPPLTPNAGSSALPTSALALAATVVSFFFYNARMFFGSWLV